MAFESRAVSLKNVPSKMNAQTQLIVVLSVLFWGNVEAVIAAVEKSNYQEVPINSNCSNLCIQSISNKFMA
jgi:hypothetical protein